MKRRATVFCIVSAFNAVVLCAQAQAEDGPMLASFPESVTPRIVGGQSSKACHWPTAGLLSVNNTSICTGTLVHPQIVMTAAHCNNNILSFSLTNSMQQPTSHRYKLEYCKSHPEWKGQETSIAKHVDFAFCKLEKPITDVPIVPIMMGCEMEYLEPGLEVYGVGFGKTDAANPASAGTKHEVRTSFNGFVDQFKGEASFGADGKGSCQGDSGGPLFVKLPEDKYGKDAGWRVFGVTSWGNETCSSFAGYGVMSTFVSFVEQESGIDITPCTDADGTWNPTQDCKGAPLDPFAAKGSWETSCESGPVGGYIQSCGEPFAMQDDTQPPSVTIVSPESHHSIKEGTKLRVKVEAKDNVAVASVELLLNDSPVGELTKPPFEWRLDELESGENTLIAVAKDEAGNDAQSAEVIIAKPVLAAPDDGDDHDDDDSPGESDDDQDSASKDSKDPSEDSDDSNGSDQDESSPGKSASQDAPRLTGCRVDDKPGSGLLLALGALAGLVRRRR